MSDAQHDKFLWGKAYARRAAHLCMRDRVCWLDEVPCPFSDTFCCDVTTEDWIRVLKHVFKEYPI